MGLLDKAKKTELVRAEINENRGVITINDPKKYNALSFEVFDGLKRAFEQLIGDHRAEVIIFTGEGPAFAAGADVRAIHALVEKNDREELKRLLTGFHQFVFAIENSSKPTIAVVSGFCLGGGMELALACDYIVAHDTSTTSFAFPEVGLGIMPGLGGTQRLPYRVGEQDAYYMILSGKSVHSKEALEIGLVDRVVGGEEDLWGAVRVFVDEVLNTKHAPSRKSFAVRGISDEEFTRLAEGKPLSAARYAREAIDGGIRNVSGLKDSIVNIEIPIFCECLFTPDAKEGLAAFIEKRRPKFSELVEAQEIAPEHSAPAVITASHIATAPPWEQEEYILLRETVRDFAKQEVEPHIEQMERDALMPSRLWRQMAELGFFGIEFPEENGGFGMGKVGVAIFAEELAYIHPSTAVVAGAHASLFCSTINLFGTADQKQRFLLPGIAGTIIGAFATSEPDVGSDVGGMKTMAEKTEGGWVLRGTKHFITNGGIASHVIVWAQTDRRGGNETLMGFIMDCASENIEIPSGEHKMGIHGSCTNRIELDGVFVPNENVLGGISPEDSDFRMKGFKMIMRVFNYSRIMLGAACVGFIRRAIDEATAYAGMREMFGQKMWEMQLTIYKFGEMAMWRHAVESQVMLAAWKADRGGDIREDAAAVKYFAAETAKKVVDMSLQMHGGSGYMVESAIERFFRDVRVFPVFEGTSEVQLLALGKEHVMKHIVKK